MTALPDPDFWRGKRVFLTGHSGFVGGWLGFWLSGLGAKVTGFALPPPTHPSFFAATKLQERLNSIEGDVRDAAAMEKAMRAADPEILLHLAAQPLVREAFRNPADTFAVNVMGTVNALEAARSLDNLQGIIVFTTDKVYRNRETGQAYKESDELGADEPYSASKSGAELVAAAYRNRYFKERCGLATIRAGNIIGGGDWAAERLVPDAIRAFGSNETLIIRRPQAIRPWQHVLEAARGLMLLTEALIRSPHEFAQGWNLGPPAEGAAPVQMVVEHLVAAWGAGAAWKAVPDNAIPEAGLLMLDSALAAEKLKWKNTWPLARALEQSVTWYRAHAERADMAALTERQIALYAREAAL